MGNGCEYRNNLCQIESMLKEHAGSPVESYMELYCCGDKERCGQYKAIKEGWVNMIEKETKKAESELFGAAGRYLSLLILKSLRS